MKKTVFILLLLGLASRLYAAPVSPEKALKVAEKVFASQPQTKATHGELRIIWDGEFEKTKADTDPDFYVVTREGGGFVIVAGNDRVRPVLGFSFENPFKVEGMPCNFEALMRGLKNYCHTAQNDSPEIQEQWGLFADTKSPFPQNLITNEFLGSRTVEWNQSDPANLMCPTVPGQKGRAVCGCTSLSFSEVMTWFGFPEKGIGTVAEYTYRTDNKVEYYYTIPSHELGTVYDWEGFQSMKTPAQFYAEQKTDLGRNLGQLLYDIGTILQASYNDGGTWCGITYMNDRLCVMMRYNKGARELNREDYPLFMWEDMLKKEVIQHPVITSGWGHSYVMDGYATYNGTEQVFHYNIGWGGYGNGYYFSYIQKIDEDPECDYINRNAIFGFYPDPSGTSEPYSLTKIVYYEEAEWGWQDHAGIYLHQESPPIKPGEWLLLGGNGIFNAGTVPIYGKLGAFYVDAKGTQSTSPLCTLDLASEEDPFRPGYVSGGWAWWIQAPPVLSFGDRFVWYYRQEGADFEPIKANYVGSFLDELPVFPAAMIEVEASYSVGEAFYFRLTNNDYTYPKAVWHITAPSGQTKDYLQSDHAIRLSERGKYTVKVDTGKETIVATITVN